MNVQVQVLKTDLPGKVDTLSCKMEAQGGGEVVTDTSKLIQEGAPALPTLNFHFKRASTHVALLFTALSSSEEVGNCLYPLTFNSRMVRLFGPLIPTALAKRPHLAHITTTVSGLEIEKVVGRIWFKIAEFKSTKKLAPDPDSSWVKLETVQNYLFSQSASPKPEITTLVSREAGITYATPVPDQTPTLSILFHSVTTKISGLTSSDILSIACIGSAADVKEDTLFNKGEDIIHTLPILKAITVKCDTATGTMLELHLANSNTDTLYFSAACPLSDLLPFKHYNWEYNWRWLPGVTGFSPEQSRGNLEPNLTVSVVCWPSLADYPDYEGLEVFVEGVEFESTLSETDLVLCCHLLDTEEKLSVPLPEHQRSKGEEENHNFDTAVIQFSPGNDKPPVQTSAYFFFPSHSFAAKLGGHQIVFILYATTHNANLWWHTDSNSTASLDLPEPLTQALSQSENRAGVRWEIEGHTITNASRATLTVKKISGILKWKDSNNKFLSKSTISMTSELPLLSDLQKRETVHESDTIWKDAVAKIGSDVLKLREEIKLLKKENREYERYILDMEASIIVTAAEQKKLQHETKDDLIHRVVELSERLKKELQASKSSQSKVHGLQNTLIKQKDVESRYVELQEAHTAQQKIVRELQAKIAKYRKFIDTCKQQEAVINQLEVLVARDARDPTRKEALEIISKENVRLRAQLSKYQGTDTDKLEINAERDKTVEALKAELLRAHNKCRDLEGEVAFLSKPTGVNSTTYFGEKDRVAELERKLEVAAIREKAVMEELKESASKWAKDKARQELEIAQLRKGSAGSTLQKTPSQSSIGASVDYAFTQQNPSIIASPGSRERPEFILTPSPGMLASARTQSDHSISTPLPTAKSHSRSRPKATDRHEHVMSMASHVTSNQSSHIPSSHITSNRSSHITSNRSSHVTSNRSSHVTSKPASNRKSRAS